MKTIAQMADDGKAKLERKGPRMKNNYEKAKTDMKTGYNETPFNSEMKSAYAAGVDAAEYRPPDPSKWARNWARKVS